MGVYGLCPGEGAELRAFFSAPLSLGGVSTASRLPDWSAAKDEGGDGGVFTPSS